MSPPLFIRIVSQKPIKDANYAWQRYCKETGTLKQTPFINPSDQHGIVGRSLLSKERPMTSSELLKAIDDDDNEKVKLPESHPKSEVIEGH